MADHHQRLAVHIDLFPAVAQDAVAAAPQAPAQHRRFMPRIVVSQDGERGNAAVQATEHGQDPAVAVVGIDHVACEGNQVGLPLVAALGHVLIKRLVRRAAHVQIAYMQDRKAVPHSGQARQPQCSFHEIYPEHFVARQASQVAPLAPANRLVTELPGHINRLRVIAEQDGRDRPQQAPERNDWTPDQANK